MNSSDRVAEDGTLKPPLPVPDYLDMLHAEHHQGVFVPTLDSCTQHTREGFERDYGHLLHMQSGKRGVRPGVGIMSKAFVTPSGYETEFVSPPFVHKLVDAIITRRTLDFGQVPVPEDVKRRLEEAFGPLVPIKPGEPADDTQILPPPTYKLRTALAHIMLGRPDAALKIVKDFSPEDAKQFLNGLQELTAMLMARYSVEFIDEMLTVDPEQAG